MSLIRLEALTCFSELYHTRPLRICFDYTLVPEVKRAFKNLKVVNLFAKILHSNSLNWLVLSLLIESNESDEQIVEIKHEALLLRKLEN